MITTHHRILTHNIIGELSNELARRLFSKNMTSIKYVNYFPIRRGYNIDKNNTCKFFIRTRTR
jgi:hypothetical protein